MKKRWNRILKILCLLAIFLGIGCLAERIPFFLFPETEEAQAAALLSSEWAKGMLPLAIMFIAAFFLIFAFLKLRMWKKGEGEHRLGDKKLLHLRRYRKKKNPLFLVVRWLCMIVCSVVVIYGGKMLGGTFQELELPIFACAFNGEQLIGSSCYYLSHFQNLLEAGPEKILIFAVSFLLSSILFGRILCGFVCPMGLVQDLLHVLRQKFHMESVEAKESTYQKLNLVKWLLLMVFLGLWILGGDFCMICPALTLSPALAGFQVSLYVSGLFMILVLVMSFLKRRAFCNICPLGYLLGLLHPISLFKLKKNAVACTECGACYEACPMGIKSVLTMREGKDEYNLDVTTADCIMCGECIRKCPENDALSLKFAGKKVYTASRMAFMEQSLTKEKRKRKE